MTGVKTFALEQRILEYLAHHPMTTRDTIALALGASRVACATNLNRLFGKGLIERHHNPEFTDGGPAYPYRWRLK